MRRPARPSAVTIPVYIAVGDAPGVILAKVASARRTYAVAEAHALAEARRTLGFAAARVGRAS